MISILSLITSIKDYLEVVHKFIEYDSVNINYTELGSMLTFFLISIKNCMLDFFSFSWLLKENFWSLPIIIPEISSAMISEISVLDGYFHNAFNFLDTPVSYGMPIQNGFISCIEKLIIGLINSFFLFLPTSTAHIITLRRFVMQGLDAGYMSGLGTIAGNIFWLASVILGCRFFVIPWLSLDIFRYVLGFILLVKYMWDSYNERKIVPVLSTSSKVEGASSSPRRGGETPTGTVEKTTSRKIFLLNFLLALTEQTSIYPFISNISINPEISMLETFPLGTANVAVNALSANGQLNVDSSSGTLFICIHLAYLLGIGLGSISLLHLSCWFWENPAFKLYMWVISSFKVSTSFYYKVLNFSFLYLTMLSAICSIPYYGLDYTITNPLGYVNDDRIIQDKVILETSFLGTKASDRNTRRNRGRHGRRERWKRRIRKYRTFDASLYDQGIYDLFTIEDLNYGFDRFWLRRKLRNHRVRFRFFPGPWMRSFKKQLAKPRLESYTGPRIEFFRILFEQVYHPSFHSYTNPSNKNLTSLSNSVRAPISNPLNIIDEKKANSNSVGYSLYSNNAPFLKKGPRFLPFVPSSQSKPILPFESDGIERMTEQRNQQPQSKKSTLRKFIRKFDNRVKTLNINSGNSNNKKAIYSKQWRNFAEREGFVVSRKGKQYISNNSKEGSKEKQSKLNNFYLTALISKKEKKTISILDYLDEQEKKLEQYNMNVNSLEEQTLKKQRKNLSKKDLQILYYRSFLTNPSAPSPYGNGRGRGSVVNKEVGERSSWGASLPKSFAPTLLPEQQTSLPIGESLMLLHPLKFYLQKEAGFKRKLRYYTPSIYRKFSVENNAPYFRVMMKRYFYNYKPSLRWERTMKTASLRKARRKTTRIPRKLQNTNLNTDLTVGISTGVGIGDGTLIDNKKISNQLLEPNQYLPIQLEKNSLQKSTYNYSVVSKRANRYRYQIYKDVLQHWYYSPFNRILLKLDVDSFIRRQPNAHFLTSKEENLLHLRRFLLSEHYNTLRWYTNMEHYRSMKTQLNGGTKSFSSRSYNQQFSGTFKKIRHLFAITPSITSVAVPGSVLPLVPYSSSPPDGLSSPLGGKNPAEFLQANVLKFDQPLYNEYANNNDNPLLNPLIIHEELLPDLVTPLKDQSSYGGNDLLSQSQNIIREYLIQTRSVREDYVKQLLSENNYAELTKFIYKGQKTRGDQPVTNQRLLNNQEKDYLLTLTEKDGKALFQQEGNVALSQKAGSVPVNGFATGTEQREQQAEHFYLTYLKKWKRHVNDQESLKNYLTRRLEKREKRKQKKEKQLLTKLQRLENWFSLNKQEKKQNFSSISAPVSFNKPGFEQENPVNSNSNSLLTSGLQKSILDGMFILKNIDSKVVSAPTGCSVPNERNLWKVLLLSKIKQKDTISDTGSTVCTEITNNKKMPFVRLQDITLRFNDLKYAQNLKLSNNLRTSIQATRKFIQKHPKLQTKTMPIKYEESEQISNKKIQLYNSFKSKILTFSNICLDSAKKAQNTFLKLQNLTNLGFASSSFSKTGTTEQQNRALSLEKIIKPIKRKSLKDWRKKERVLGKQKRSRKEFKLLNKKTESISTYLDRNELELALQSSSRSSRPLFPTQREAYEGQRKKREINTNNEKEKTNILNSLLSFRLGKDLEQSLVTNTFKRKRSPQRRSRVRRNRGVFKKRTLSDSLRKDFLLFYNEKNPTLKSQYYQKFNENLYANSNVLPFSQPKGVVNKNEEVTQGAETALKQRKSKQRKERYWKQKRSKYAQKRRKYRKRRRYTIVKIRTLNKQFKRIKNQIEIQNWWWKQFIPSIQASNEALWQIEKDKLIQQKLSQLSTTEILERDNLNNSNFNILQIGNKDFKPLALPQAIRLNKETTQSKQTNNTLLFSGSNLPTQNSSLLFDSPSSPAKEERAINNKFNVVNKLYESLFINNKNSSSTEFLVPNTNLPFYAGWDESLRKLIVTNRMLSRKEAGFSLPRTSSDLSNLTPLTSSLPLFPVSPEEQSSPALSQRGSMALQRAPSLQSHRGGREGFAAGTDQQAATQKRSGLFQREEFTLAPLQGMNAATTLYWQIPFTTYDPDQFFALGMDGFSPIGWRKFLFRHSILKTWLVNKESIHFNNSNSLSPPQDSKEREASLFPAGSKKPFPPLEREEQGEKKAAALVVKTRSNILKDFSLLSLSTERSKQQIWSRALFAVPSLRSGEDRSTGEGTQQPFHLSPEEKASKAAVTNEYEQKKSSFAVSRRLKKRYRRVKKHPRTPVWFPSGPLLNQVLPVHYIYVFYKRARLPRDRYLKRRLINVKDFNLRVATEGAGFTAQSVPIGTEPQTLSAASSVSSLQNERDGSLPKGRAEGVLNLLNYDFTLRKRLKPKRKYHLKRDYYASNVVIPRRFKFMSIYSSDTNIKKWRPLSSLKIHKPISEVVKEQQLLRRSAQQKQRSSKQQQPSMRVKQLRRRVQRQILRSVWRYRPRAGGFVWPGDYLKLELVKAPKLQPSTSLAQRGEGVAALSQGEREQATANMQTNSVNEKTTSAGLLSLSGLEGKKQSPKQKRKKKRTLVEWQIQPKKYLYEKHNIKVLKKKLLKSQRSFGSNTTTLNVLRNSI
jgi:hypothetical protein